MKYLVAACIMMYALSCKTKNIAEKAAVEKKDSVTAESKNDVAAILSKKEVPVLCYHHIRNFTSARLQQYEVTPSSFAAQMKALYDSGYHTILPDQLYDYLIYNKQLPSKPVMITFDDNDKEQYTIGEQEMKKYGFKGVYFIMTISINRKRYMSAEELKELSDSGNIIAGHTWDHHKVTDYTMSTWDSQLVMPQKKLEGITGKPVNYFAFPFGIWNKEAIPVLKQHGYKMAFILSTKRDSTEPLYTIRRMIVPGQWTPQGMIRTMRTTFHLQ